MVTRIKKILFLFLTLVFVAGITLAQNDPVKNKEENKLQYQQEEQKKNEIKNQVQTKSEGENQIRNQIQTQNQEQSKNQNQNQERNQNQVHGPGFVDLDGDGINDYAVDSDGDGIPNGQDPDYVRPKDGTGQQYRNGKGENKKGKMWGPNDGTGNDGIGPKDGTGYGSSSGKGNSSGTGTGSGSGKRGGR